MTGPVTLEGSDEIARRNRVRDFVAKIDRNPPMRVTAAELVSIDRGLADCEAGRSYSHEQVESIVALFFEEGET